MNMRSGLDSSVWNRQRSGTSIGEALGAVQGVMGIVGRAREKKKEEKDLEENEYLNTVFGERLQGWDGKDQDDYLNRTGAALNDVLAADPKTYKKATAILADAAEQAYKAQDQELQIAGKKTANEAATVELDTKTIASRKADMEYNTALNGLVSHYLDMARNGEMPLDTAILHIQKNTNLKRDQLRLPTTEDEFKANPGQWVDPYLAEQERLKKQLAGIDAKNKKSALNQQLSQEKISKVGADFIEREKDLGLRKGEADLSKVQRDLNKPEPSAMDGIDPETGKPYTAMQNKSAAYAITMGRGLKNIDSLIEKGFDEANFVDQVLTKFEKKKQLSRFEFLNIAKTPEQRMYLQAQLDFMVPHLRDQSGAVINADEYTTEAQQYFPRPQETQPEVEQKRNARVQEFVARRTIGGSRYNQILKDYEAEMESRKKGASAPASVPVEKFKTSSGREYTF